MKDHTPGRLCVEPTLAGTAIIRTIADEDYGVAAMCHQRGDVAWKDADRLVACWNACVGVPDETLARMAAEPCVVVLTSEFDELKRDAMRFRALMSGAVDNLGVFDHSEPYDLVMPHESKVLADLDSAISRQHGVTL